MTALENNSIIVASAAAGTSGIKYSFENLHVSAALSDADVRSCMAEMLLVFFAFFLKVAILHPLKNPQGAWCRFSFSI